jgi:hypothetical protein
VRACVCARVSVCARVRVLKSEGEKREAKQEKTDSGISGIRELEVLRAS